MAQLYQLSSNNTSTGSGPPTSTPTKEGDIYIDTLNNEPYIAAGTSSSSDWKKSSEAQPFFEGSGWLLIGPQLKTKSV